MPFTINTTWHNASTTPNFDRARFLSACGMEG